MESNGSKHIFYVHSYITYIVALSVIQQLQLPSKDILLIFGRGFSAPLQGFRAVTLTPSESALAHVPTYGERFLLIRKQRSLAAVDNVVETFIGKDTYTAYLPSTRNYLMQRLATHRQCVRLNLLEEGLMTYTGEALKPTSSHYKSVGGRIKACLKYLDHGGRSTYYYKEKDSHRPVLFAVSAEAKRVLPNFHVEVLEKLVIPPIPDNYVSAGDRVFFMDPLVEQNITSIDHLVVAVRSLPDLGFATGKLWLRWHPAQQIQQEFSQRLVSIGVNHDVIPGSIAAESILLSCHDLNVLGFGSSLLFYAALWGHKSYSLLATLGRIDPKALERYGIMTMPEVFNRHVKVI